MPNMSDQVWQTAVPLRWPEELLVAVTEEKPQVLVMERCSRAVQTPTDIWGAANKEFHITESPILQKYTLHFLEVLWFPTFLFAPSQAFPRNIGKNYDQKGLEFSGS